MSGFPKEDVAAPQNVRNPAPKAMDKALAGLKTESREEHGTELRQENRVEILAPVGGPEGLQAAVWAGADCVYLGLKAFNARRGAQNFDARELAEAVHFCHGYGVGVHVTLNTLLYPGELAELERSIGDICAAGADVVIVQDMAVATLVRRCAPGLRLHGSTQMAVCDVAGAKQLAALGFSRAILARELSGEEIALITRECGIETEVFVHGAQCMCVSGQCYMSAFFGGRSGNRGGCAQPCRLPFTAFEGTAPERRAAEGDHHLSLKDLSLIDRLPQLAAAGVKSVKIEGRLRSPEYVAAAVNACRRARDGKPFDAALLEQVFSRSGFTDAYFAGRPGKTMFGMRRPEDAALSRRVQPQLRELYRRPSSLCAVELHFTLEAEGAKLSAFDGTHRVVVYSEQEPQPSQGDNYAAAVRRSLEKTGGTPFFAKTIQTDCAPGWYLPLSEVNIMRRTVLEKLEAARAQAASQPFVPCALSLPQPAAQKAQLLVGRFESAAQLLPETAQLLEQLIFPLCEAEKIPQALRVKTVLEVPRGNFGASSGLQKSIEAARAMGYTRFEANNIGHIALLVGCEIFGGFALNILNPLAACAYRDMGLSALTLSCETHAADLPSFGTLPVGVIGYGSLPVMMTRACPMHNITDCAHCDKAGFLLDRKGEQLPVRCRGSVREIYNPIPIWLGDRRREFDCDFLTLYFTGESPERVAQLVHLFAQGQPFDGRFTRGLYYNDEK